MDDVRSSDSLTDSGNSPEDTNTRAELRSLKHELDALEITVMAQKKVWYRDASTIIAILALLFSFGTTYVSYRRTEGQDIENESQELRGFLEKLATLPQDSLAATKKYQGDSAALVIAGSSLNEENALLLREAIGLVKKLPRSEVSATDYFAIGTALQNSYNLGGAKEYFADAIKSANDFNDEISAIRSEASVDFLTGHPQDGRLEYQKALDIFSKYSGYDKYTQASTNVYTDSAWALSEAGLPDISAAQQRLDDAEHLINGLPFPNSPGVNSLKLQVAQIRQKIQQPIPSVPGESLQPLPALVTPRP